MNLEFFLDKASGVGSFFLLPVIFLPLYFVWSRFFDYPVVLEKHIRNGKTWPYLPIYWKGNKRKLIRAASILLFWVASLSFSCALYYLFPISHWILLIAGMGISIFAEFKIRLLATDEIVRLQRDRYFQIYTKLSNQALAKGEEISDSQLSAKAQWQQQNDFRIADKQGRFMPFLKGEAKL